MRPSPIPAGSFAGSDRKLVDAFSLEITTKDTEALRKAQRALPLGTTVSVTALPGEALDVRLSAIRATRDLGFEPMPHFAARSVSSREELEHNIRQSRVVGQVDRCFVIAGDNGKPTGPFSDSLGLIETGVFESNGVRILGIGGHPDGHPHMSEEECWKVLSAKCSAIEGRGMSPLIVTQFAFDADRVLSWLAALRGRGIGAPVEIGVPGPTSVSTLVRYAARCGVGASASVLAKYGISIGHLLGSAGPDRFVNKLSVGLVGKHGAVKLHFYPFGGISKTVEWIEGYVNRQ
ncbi:methylenetetrahydrofolate reductase [Rhizobium sp. P38BS-XIX]|uniref:methylenetetrahydrofolate reductase n=1 Tax=Rhizobium sp. P38BS-XIX TaxID=2726740 RepID=UPI0014569B0A|nr:methylenetetrahydrofolate reductase [Rhizobium sp. P38BS-XIX]NLR97350.1 methylenetetrahydrofolate reductase [Rhizobium sp. P38BS-XIX]